MSSRSERALSLAEVVLAMAILAIFSLAMTMVLLKGLNLDQRDREVTEMTMLANQIMDETAREAADPLTFDRLAGSAVHAFADNRNYLYATTVAPLANARMKRVSVVLYFADPQAPGRADRSRPEEGRAIRMSTIYNRPTQARPPQ